MDMNSVPVAGYTQHSCTGGCVGDTVAGGDLPSLQDIAAYNYLTPEQRQQQSQQLQQASESAFAGLPWHPSSGRTANNASQVQPNASQVQAAQTAKEKKTALSAPVLPGTQSVAGMQSVAGAQTTAGTQMTPGTTTSTPLIPDQTAPITPTTQPFPVTGESLQYLNGFLRTQIGRAVRVSFLIGTNTFQDRSGILMGVGANYILLQEAETDDLLACDFYNIKFVTFYY